MLEAKTDSNWGNSANQSQVQKKIKRLGVIFGSTGSRWSNVIPHFSIVSPESGSFTDPSTWTKYQPKSWPKWILNNNKLNWMHLPIPNLLLKVTRCDQNGKTTNYNSWKTIKR